MESHLLQMRGLKPPADVAGPIMGTSHLLQMRGLKHTKDADNQIRYQVASFTDAWIETKIADKRAPLSKSHLLQMRGLKLCVADVAF